MKAERTYGAADGSEMVIDRVSDGMPLPDCQGWTCSCCETIYDERDDAEWCCVARPPL